MSSLDDDLDALKRVYTSAPAPDAKDIAALRAHVQTQNAALRRGFWIEIAMTVAALGLIVWQAASNDGALARLALGGVAALLLIYQALSFVLRRDAWSALALSERDFLHARRAQALTRMRLAVFGLIALPIGIAAGLWLTHFGAAPTDVIAPGAPDWLMLAAAVAIGAGVIATLGRQWLQARRTFRAADAKVKQVDIGA